MVNPWHEIFTNARLQPFRVTIKLLRDLCDHSIDSATVEVEVKIFLKVQPLP